MNTPLRIDVALDQHSYPIHIGPGLLDHTALWRDHLRGVHVLLVSDTNVAPLYAQRLHAGLDGRHWSTLILPAGEPAKTLANVQQVYEALSALGANRDACVIALGGGVIGDLSGFAAASWMRGIDFLPIPTTLLAMVDASVGGKTGVNLPSGKNLVGAFHQPCGVLIDTDTLATLPEREYRAGLAEVVKYGAIFATDFMDWLAKHSPALQARDPQALTEAIARSCRFKAAIVAQDPTEQGQRALLNFGHSFAHALETASGYGHLLHGEAVAIGMLQAARLSTRLGLARLEDEQRLGRLLAALHLPLQPPPGLNAETLLQHMRLDKKNQRGKLRLILWRGVGQVEIVANVEPAAILQTLDDLP